MITTRAFVDYTDYIVKQGGKARRRRDYLLAHLPKQTGHYAEIFRYAAAHLRPGAVLCLGARTGAESLGAEQAGFPGSVGIDLHPVGPTVRQGDWHDLQFPKASFANVYTNSLDHCLYLERFAAEVRRVLQKHGRFYLMATNRQTTVETWRTTCPHEALHWQASDDLRDAIGALGFAVTQEWRDGKWGHYVFQVCR